MLFNIFTSNFGSLTAVQSQAPLIDYLRKTLSACGHDVIVEYNRIHTDAINLLFENFINESLNREISNMRREKGIRFGIIATELMQEEGFIHAGSVTYAGATDQESMTSLRLDGFAEVVKSVDFVWSFLSRTADYLSNSVAISEWLPIGHIEDMPAELRRSPKNIDICFFGKVTPHRKSVINSLVDSGLQVVAVGTGFPPLEFLPWPLLVSLLDQSKIALSITLHAADEAPAGIDPRTASCLRVIECLRRDIILVSEDIPLDNPYEDFMESAPIVELPVLCKRLLEDGSWEKLGQQKGKKFRKVMDARKMCTPVIERTLTAMGLEGK
jgi:hypothetical protein